MKKLVLLAVCCAALCMVGGLAKGGVEFDLSQQMLVWTSSPSVAWAYAEWSYGSNSYVNLGSGVGGGGQVAWSNPYYNTWYAAYFYDYSLGRFYSIMYSRFIQV
jgi:hypothetical protein